MLSDPRPEIGARVQHITSALRAATLAVASLNPMERAILEAMADGKTVEAAGDAIGLSAASRQTRVERILTKLSADSLEAALAHWNLVSAAARAAARASACKHDVPRHPPTSCDTSELALEVLSWIREASDSSITGCLAAPAPPIAESERAGATTP